MYMDAKILANIIANRIQWPIKRMIHHDQIKFMSGLQGWFDNHKSMYGIHYLNRRKNKNHRILSTDAEKAFDKLKYAFLIKTLQHGRIEGTYLHIIKAIDRKPTTNNIPNGEKLRALPFSSGT